MSLDSDTQAALDRTIEWLGIPWRKAMTHQLGRYAEWLTSEGIQMGGIGPDELPRLWQRHLLDGLLLGKDFGGGRLLDMGSGVGLPGIPLAIAFPTASVVLVERSGRRVDGIRRAAAVLDISLEVVQGDLHRVRLVADRVVTRATLPPAEAVPASIRLLGDRGEAWIALGRGGPEQRLSGWSSILVPEGWKATIVEVPPEILDSPVWMLRIART